MPVQTAKWTLGPSLPIARPEPIDKGRASDFITRVRAPRNPFMMKPAMMTLISDIPEPAAYGANALTSFAEQKAKRI